MGGLHLGSAVGVASAVTFNPSGLAVVTTTDVQAAIAELDAAVDALGGGGGGGGASPLLAVTAWDIGTETSDAPAGTSAEDLDASNAVVTFTVPASGAVLVRLSAMAYVSQSILMWGLREGSTTVDEMEANETNNANNFITSLSTTFYVAGLTPAASKTYKWMHRKGTGGGSAATRYGATWGAVIMEVWAVP